MLGFTPAEIHRAQAKPKLTVEQLLEIESCQEYVKTLLQTLDGFYIHQPKRFLPLAKETKKLAEAFKKEQVASQWAGIHMKNYFKNHLLSNSLQTVINLGFRTYGLVIIINNKAYALYCIYVFISFTLNQL